MSEINARQHQDGGQKADYVECGLNRKDFRAWYRGSGQSLQTLAPWIVIAIAIIGVCAVAGLAVSAAKQTPPPSATSQDAASAKLKSGKAPRLIRRGVEDDVATQR